jgi:hypothetical protein
MPCCQDLGPQTFGRLYNLVSQMSSALTCYSLGELAQCLNPRPAFGNHGCSAASIVRKGGSSMLLLDEVESSALFD